MSTLAHSGVFWVGLIAGLIPIYFLPIMIGLIRKVESLGLLIFLNVLPTGRAGGSARSCSPGRRKVLPGLRLWPLR